MRRTQRAIKHALTERFYSWRDAETLAKTDPEIDLSGNGPVYNPKDFEEAEEDLTSEQDVQPEAKPVERTAPNP